MTVLHLFLVGQLVTLPALAPGSEVRLVSPDLLRVHASGRLEGGVLRMAGELPPGLELRMLIFPPDAGPDEAAAALAGATALTARVSDDGTNLRIVPPDGDPFGWREALAEQDVRLVLPGDVAP